MGSNNIGTGFLIEFNFAFFAYLSIIFLLIPLSLGVEDLSLFHMPIEEQGSLIITSPFFLLILDASMRSLLTLGI